MLTDRDDTSLQTNLRPFQHNSNHISSEYRCYIPLHDGRFLTATLRLPSDQDTLTDRMKIIVHIPTRSGWGLVGQLQRGVGRLPAWIPRAN